MKTWAKTTSLKPRSAQEYHGNSTQSAGHEHCKSFIDLVTLDALRVCNSPIRCISIHFRSQIYFQGDRILLADFHNFFQYRVLIQRHLESRNDSLGFPIQLVRSIITQEDVNSPSPLGRASTGTLQSLGTAFATGKRLRA